MNRYVCIHCHFYHPPRETLFERRHGNDKNDLRFLPFSASGDVQPCPLVNLSLGNVLDESLASICRRIQSLLSGPRCDLLCSQLGPLVSGYVAEGGEGCAVLPIPPEKSVEILSGLPASLTPKAWVL